ncbi:N-acetylmuramoyl-L-alanine amidase [Daejeonella oryzae]|uniref:N-acetylmuramoyl-L-alanine amidase n=1 Tax=Daejeonella oryzae TaxID=1122943 RepID=UPI0004134F29|nr:N-acetylmuramoyl-L-alanine amidase [Daejeonella oryzae]
MKLPIYQIVSACLLAVTITSCASNPYAVTNRIYKKQTKELAKTIREIPATQAGQDWAGTTNFSLRKPNYVIIHHTAQNSAEQTLKTFTMPKTQVSAHYVIAKDGKVYHMLNDYLRAWHGGSSKWGNATDINSSSIGIELDNNGYEAFSESQMGSLVNVLSSLKTNYSIPTANFIGHSDIAPGRKVDPNANFPWKDLSEKGFGLWPDAVLDSVPQNFNPPEALRIIGYDIKNLEYAIRSFKLHFIQNDLSPMLTEFDKQVLYNLYKKYL